MTLVDLAHRNWPPAGTDNEVFQQEAPTRAENIAALKREITDAKWQDVAIRLSGAGRADLHALCAVIPNRDLQATRSAVERHLAGSPGEPAILKAIDARARRRKVSLRPLGSRIWAAYTQVGYNIWRGEQMRDRVWEHIGGSVGTKYTGHGHDTCAARISWSFNYGGWPITGRGETNKTGTSYNGKKGDGKNYIVWVPSMQDYLIRRWGPPEKTLRTTLEAVAFERTLGPGEVAVFAGLHHSGLIMPGYNDAYVKSDPSVLPVSVWKLPL